ncbi:MAG: type II toxin-antitoxin system HicA family toxin [Chloroflexi bacterium]|nr:type II toxin-antitoxin system HicA family toxin [Chloroflexota bacterium]
MTYRELTRKLRRLNCNFARQASGSHEIWMNTLTNAKTTIPNKRGRDLKPGTLRSIIRDLGISRNDLDQA